MAFLHTSTANHNHLCTPTANEKGLCTLNEVKTVPLNTPLTHFLPPTNSYIQPPPPPPQSANYQVASSFQTQHRIEVIKRVYSKTRLYEKNKTKQNKRQTKLYTVVQNDVKLQHQQAFKIYHLMPINTNKLPINKKHNTKLALILENCSRITFPGFIKETTRPLPSLFVICCLSNAA